MKLWIDECLFSFADVARLTGYAPSRIRGLIRYRLFKTQHLQKHGGPRSTGIERRTYTARDVLRLQLLGPLVTFGVHLRAGHHYGRDRQMLTGLIQGMDKCLDAQISGSAVGTDKRVIFPGEFAPWVHVVADLPAFVKFNYQRVDKFRRLRDQRVPPDVAARQSLLALQQEQTS